MTAIFNLGRANLPGVLEVEGACGPPVWAEDDFLSRLRDKNCILFFTEDAGGVATGYMSYRLAPRSLFLERIAVHPGQRRRGHGSALLSKLRSKMDLKGRKCVLTEVDEANTGAHLFFKANGWKAIEVRGQTYVFALSQ